MALFNLKKLLLKKDTSRLIDELVDSLGVDILIRDSVGNSLYGDEVSGPLVPPPPVGVPIVSEGQAVGWVYGDDGKTAVIASALNYLVKTEVEKKALATEALDKYNELTMLYDFVERVNAFNVREIGDFLIKQVLVQIHADNVSVMVYNEKTGSLEVIAASGTCVESETTLKLGMGIAGSVVLTGKAEIINDCLSDKRYISRNNISSLICAPIKTKEKTIGVVSAGTIKPYNYTANDLKFFSTLVSQAAFAIDNARLYEHLKEAFITTINTLADTIEKRDPYTGGHTKRVMNYSALIGEGLGLSTRDMKRLELASILHDIGKIGVSDNVLLKTSRLTEEEFDEIKMHPVYGQEILSHIEELKDVIPGIKSHHERVDGKGYPDGLMGEEIDLIARIIAVADSFDAMTSDRPYRKGLSLEAALEELRKCSGTQFDTKVVEAFLNAYKKNSIN
ncbi:MAG: HD domain-containing protein [Nitrospirae bacterium]|nr:HD domain-containing protein [Nitrospirota bacterium]MBF0590860.1 HD domain-containing protein [Nitrospirota bacterium]